MIPRDLPYNEKIRTKTHCENKFSTQIIQIPFMPLENAP